MRFFDMKENLHKIWDEKTDILFHANVCQIFIFDCLFRSCTYSRLKFQKTGQKVGPAHIFSYQEPTISSANNRKDFFWKKTSKTVGKCFWHTLFKMMYVSFFKKKKAPKTQGFRSFFYGSPCWTRTNDPAVNSRMLYRLSYWGLFVLASSYCPGPSPAKYLRH